MFTSNPFHSLNISLIPDDVYRPGTQPVFYFGGGGEVKEGKNFPNFKYFSFSSKNQQLSEKRSRLFCSPNDLAGTYIPRKKNYPFQGKLEALASTSPPAYATGTIAETRCKPKFYFYSLTIEFNKDFLQE